MTDPQEYCSFCGKHRSLVTKLVAGPHASICNECVAISSEVLRDDERTRNSLDAAIRDYLTRALDDLESARILAANDRRRVAVELARTSTQSSLMAYELLRDGHVSYLDFEKLVSALLFDDEQLRGISGLNVTPLLKELRGGEPIADFELNGALETARLVYDFVSLKAAT